jgi:hypothetical protein
MPAPPVCSAAAAAVVMYGRFANRPCAKVFGRGCGGEPFYRKVSPANGALPHNRLQLRGELFRGLGVIAGLECADVLEEGIEPVDSTSERVSV